MRLWNRTHREREIEGGREGGEGGREQEGCDSVCFTEFLFLNARVYTRLTKVSGTKQ